MVFGISYISNIECSFWMNANLKEYCQIQAIQIQILFKFHEFFSRFSVVALSVICEFKYI